MLLGKAQVYGICGLGILIAALSVTSQFKDPLTYEQRLAQRAAEQKIYDDAMASVRAKYAVHKDADSRRRPGN